MSVETANLPQVDSGLGVALLARDRQQQLITLLKIGLVWIVLILAVFGALLAMQFDVPYIFSNFDVVLRGLAATVGISLASVLLASALALAGALGRLSDNSIARGLAGFYVSLVRGTPLLVQLYVVYLGLPRIVLPQAIRVIIPDIGNQFIAMQKDSTLVSVFGLWEMTYLARELGKRDSKYLEMFLVAAIMYWVLTMISSWIQQRLERSMAHAYER